MLDVSANTLRVVMISNAQNGDLYASLLGGKVFVKQIGWTPALCLSEQCKVQQLCRSQAKNSPVYLSIQM